MRRAGGAGGARGGHAVGALSFVVDVPVDRDLSQRVRGCPRTGEHTLLGGADVRCALLDLPSLGFGLAAPLQQEALRRGIRSRLGGQPGGTLSGQLEGVGVGRWRHGIGERERDTHTRVLLIRLDQTKSGNNMLVVKGLLLIDYNMSSCAVVL